MAMVELPELIEWHEGMLLTPQHFQQFVARGELLSQFLFTQSCPLGWGLLNLKIDETALGAGLVRILNIEAILPDGLLVLAGSERGVELEFDLQKAEQDPTRIYLAVPREQDLYQRSDYSRYEAVVNNGMSLDDVSGAESVAIPRIRPRVRLVSGDSEIRAMTVLPLIEFAREGSICKPTEYIPSLMRVRSGSAVAELCAPVRKMVRDKATGLAMRMGVKAKQADMFTLLQVQSLVASLPLLEAMLNSEQAHPYQVYLALCSMAGNVAFLSHSRIPPIFPAYDHQDLLPTFEAVLGFIRQSLSEGLIENWVGRELKLTSGPGAKSFELAPTLEQAMGENADLSAPFHGLMLRAAPGIQPESLVDWGETCLLASEDQIAEIEMSRTLGATLERVEAIDDLLPMPGCILMRVTNDSGWIVPNKKLVVKSARQEMYTPDSVTLFVKHRVREGKDG